MLSRPAPSEYNPHYEPYISKVPDGPLLAILRQQQTDIAGFLRSIPEAKAGFRYAEGKWSVKEVVGHTIDTERVMAYRLLRAARGDRTPLSGFEENAFVAGANFDVRPMPDLIREFEATRQATLALAESLTDEAWQRTTIANGSDVSARALGYIIAGHAYHHINIIRDRYLG